MDQSRNDDEGGRHPQSSGPLRLFNHEGSLYVTGFGLWIPVADETEGLDLIQELENQGYRICH